VIIAAVITLITYVLFNKTVYGKNIYAIGGNAEAARVSGVNVGRTLIVVYTVAGLLYGLGGALEAARTGGATNNYGNGYELDAIAACVVGGVSNLGGIGTVPGIVIGVLIFSVINYGLTFINMSPYWQQIVKGAIIIAAVSLDIRKYLTKR
jgi:methyl-galactoside transport system permease protein